MSGHVKDLWHGRIPLSRAFWEYAIIYGSVAALITTLLSLAAFANGWPVALGLAIHFLTTPYNLFMIVAVWRSASRYQGAPVWAMLARGLIIVWAIIATLA
jgi:hypothetical protein